jgi:DNA-binding transcriptional LysR family regulator
MERNTRWGNVVQQPFDHTQKSLNKSPLDDPRLLSGPFWGELRVFLAVAKAKSFNKAAEELNMSQPTVSRQVRRLQDVIGSQLVVSSQNNIKLTAKGRELAEMLIALDEQLFEISHELKAETKEAEGLVRISVTEALAGLFIAPNLLAFSEKHPKVQLHIRNPTNLTAFRDNQTDIMIGYAPANGGVLSKPLGYVHLVPIASRNYIERYGMPTRSNLESHLFIDTEYYTSKTGVWSQWQTAITRGVVAHFCDNSFAYGLLVKSGLGIGLLGTYTLADPVAIPLDLNVHISLPIYILAMPDRLQAKPVRIVYDWLSEIFDPSSPWFARDLTLRDLPTNALEGTIERILSNPHVPPDPIPKRTES